MTRFKTLYVLVMLGTGQQDIGRQAAVVEDASIVEPRSGTTSSGGNHHRPEWYRTGSVLPQAVGTCRKGQGSGGDRAQDRRAVLQ